MVIGHVEGLEIDFISMQVTIVTVELSLFADVWLEAVQV
jgi:hypothetical protein